MTGGSNSQGRHTAHIRVAKDHPALPGHFPGQPVVPGVVVLDLVLEAAERQLGRSLPVAELIQVKFPSPLLPEEDAQASFHLDGARLAFEVERGGRSIARGAFRLRSLPIAPTAGESRPQGSGA